jgi:hypothetical protein
MLNFLAAGINVDEKLHYIMVKIAMLHVQCQLFIENYWFGHINYSYLLLMK